jgi:hypothetical protein
MTKDRPTMTKTARLTAAALATLALAGGATACGTSQDATPQAQKAKAKAYLACVAAHEHPCDAPR